MARGSRPGEYRGGRHKGTPNKQSQAVIDWLKALGCDPIEGMARIAMDETADLSIRRNVQGAGAVRCASTESYRLIGGRRSNSNSAQRCRMQRYDS
jgi:hypothetical protein